MLAGGQYTQFLDLFVHDFSERFSEPDGVQWGAYGHRWRHHFGQDQVENAIVRLKLDPNDRRVVIQMWDATCDMVGTKKDHPCNLMVVPRIAKGKLDITVYNRSNDAVWGAFGSNAVHFAYLQYYLAQSIGVKVGTYYQISTNMHVYEDTLGKLLVRNRGRMIKSADVPTELSRDVVESFAEGVPTPDQLNKVIEHFGDQPSWRGQDYPPLWWREFTAMEAMYLSWKDNKELHSAITRTPWTRAAEMWVKRRLGDD